tara:strand:+ start:121 stop:387 length:267 start_codon:yes stop_codon:yes gene_type:complete
VVAVVLQAHPHLVGLVVEAVETLQEQVDQVTLRQLVRHKVMVVDLDTQVVCQILVVVEVELLLVVEVELTLKVETAVTELQQKSLHLL